MPLYEFKCHSCGIFEQWRSLSQLSTPMQCPTCEAIAQRIFSPPNINLNSGSVLFRRKQTKEPQVVKRSHEGESPKPQYKQHNHGRPWMISH